MLQVLARAPIGIRIGKLCPLSNLALGAGLPGHGLSPISPGLELPAAEDADPEFSCSSSVIAFGCSITAFDEGTSVIVSPKVKDLVRASADRLRNSSMARG